MPMQRRRRLRGAGWYMPSDRKTADGGKTWETISPDLSRGSYELPASVMGYADAAKTQATRRGGVYAIRSEDGRWGKDLGDDQPGPFPRIVRIAGECDGVCRCSEDAGYAARGGICHQIGRRPMGERPGRRSARTFPADRTNCRRV